MIYFSAKKISKEILDGVKDSINISLDAKKVVFICFFIFLFTLVNYFIGDYISLNFLTTELLILGHVKRQIDYNNVKNRRNCYIGVFISKITDYYFVWLSLERLYDWLPFYISILGWPLYFSYSTFQPILSLNKKSFSERISYFRDRWAYFSGYGLFMAASYAIDVFPLNVITVLAAINSKNIFCKEKKPQYARWIPHREKFFEGDFEEIVEDVAINFFGYLRKW